jgi:S-sulfosulfanyl-L-cysteine sulfohydrolase
MTKNRKLFTVIQLNDSHAYFDLHQEMFWQGGKAVCRPAGGYARIAAIVKQIRAANRERVLFCDCGDTLHGTYSALKTQGQATIPVLNSLGIDAMTAHWEFAYGPAIFKQRAVELGYPMLAINVYDQATKERLFPPYSVKEIGGLRIGLVGIASNIIDKTMPPSFSERTGIHPWARRTPSDHRRFAHPGEGGPDRSHLPSRVFPGYEAAIRGGGNRCLPERPHP